MKDDPAMAWVMAARGGDEAAATRLVGGFHARIFAYLRRLSGSETEATELTQRTFCRAWSSLGGFAGRASVSSWLHGIAYRTFVDWLRSPDRRSEVRSDAWWEILPDRGPRPDLAVADKEAAALVYAAVDRLEASLRDTLHLHYYQGLSLEETADALGVATSTVKYRAREALGRLQREFARADQPQPSSPHRTI